MLEAILLMELYIGYILHLVKDCLINKKDRLN